jgi:hypothetical protein
MSWTRGKTKRADGNPDQGGDSLWRASNENPPKNFRGNILLPIVSMSVLDSERMASFIICSNLSSPKADSVIADPNEIEKG